MEVDKNLYFKGLDGLRAIGALSVFLGHIELTKANFSVPNLIELPFYKYTSGHLGVVLFFVLSGFLITYLLLEEKRKFKTISLKKFYFRRILRIWPIYYLILFVLIFILPIVFQLDNNIKIELNNFNYSFYTLLIFFLMVPNFMAFGIPGISGGFHLNSIGTEEQFYLFWPLLIKLFNHLFIPLIIIFCFFALAPVFCDYLNNNYFKNTTNIYLFIKHLRLFFEYFKVDCMALGGLFAYIYLKKKTFILNIFTNKYTQIVSLTIGFGFWVLGIRIHYLKDEFYALFFAIIILNTAVNPNKLISFDYKLLNYLGRISYGIYVYHWLIILIVLNFTIQFKENSIVFNSILYIVSFGITILCAHFSFYKFEKYFLKFKDRFSTIKTNSTEI